MSKKILFLTVFADQRFWKGPRRAHYDIHPDGQRFLMMNMQGSEGSRPRINIVLNWFEELKRLVPTDN
jgi:hypothetical protein